MPRFGSTKPCDRPLRRSIERERRRALDLTPPRAPRFPQAESHGERTSAFERVLGSRTSIYSRRSRIRLVPRGVGCLGVPCGSCPLTMRCSAFAFGNSLKARGPASSLSTGLEPGVWSRSVSWPSCVSFLAVSNQRFPCSSTGGAPSQASVHRPAPEPGYLPHVRRLSTVSGWLGARKLGSAHVESALALDRKLPQPPSGQAIGAKLPVIPASHSDQEDRMRTARRPL